MKKQLLLFAMLIAMFTAVAQDTITGFTFPVNSGPDSLNANLGSPTNMGYDLRFQLAIAPDEDSTINTVYFADGAETYAAATAGWQDGADAKFWSIKFKAANYTNFKVSSKQKSIDGPRDFKLQWRLSSTTFEDITGGTVTLADDWTTGVVNQLAVPIAGQGTGSVYIRWLMGSNIDVNGSTVSPGGTSMIDDILVTATSSLGVDEVVYTNRIRIYPVPSNGIFTVKSLQPMEYLAIVDASGRCIHTALQPGSESQVNISGAPAGNYILQVRFTDSDKSHSKPFTIR